MEKTAERLTGLVDVNTVIGNPIVSASGAQIIPFTKVTMGYLSGGGEYGEVKANGRVKRIFESGGRIHCSGASLRAYAPIGKRLRRNACPASQREHKKLCACNE